ERVSVKRRVRDPFATMHDAPSTIHEMLTLAFDTATDRLSVAARRDGGPVAEREVTGARRHAGALVPAVLAVLDQLGASVSEVGGLALSDGPGSFTGLRVGAALAKGLAAARGLPIWTASTLLVRAAGAGAAAGATVLAVAGALRGDRYVAAYRLTLPFKVEPLLPPRVLSPDVPPPADLRPDLVVSELDHERLNGWS